MFFRLFCTRVITEVRQPLFRTFQTHIMAFKGRWIKLFTHTHTHTRARACTHTLLGSLWSCWLSRVRRKLRQKLFNYGKSYGYKSTSVSLNNDYWHFMCTRVSLLEFVHEPAEERKMSSPLKLWLTWWLHVCSCKTVAITEDFYRELMTTNKSIMTLANRHLFWVLFTF